MRRRSKRDEHPARLLTNAAAPSVIQIRAEHILPRFVGPAILETLDVAARMLEAGALVTIDPRRHRIRLLPLQSGEHR